MGFHYRISGDHLELAPGLEFRVGVLDGLGLSHLSDVNAVNDWRIIPQVNSFILGPKDATPTNWLRVSDKLEIGWDDIPGPEQLERPKMLPGYFVDDAVGNKWLIPNANPESSRCSIPQDYQWTMSGPRMVPHEEYRDVMQFCEQTFQTMLDSDNLSQEWAGNTALRILQTNYRIGTPELMALDSVDARLLNKNIAAVIVAFFIDYQLLDELVKKKSAEEPSSLPAG